MTLTFGLSPILLAALLLVAALAAWWMYRRTVPVLPGGIRGVLGLLRFLALGLILFLLAQPLLRRVTERTEPPLLAVLIDGSASMTISPDDDPDVRTPASEVPGVVEALRSGLGAADVHWFEFGGSLREASPDSIGFGMGRTDVAEALTEASRRLADPGLSGVILVSDGRHNTGHSPLAMAERYPVPVHAIVVGDTLTRSDVQVRDVATNELAYRGRELPFEITLRHSGFGGRTVSVSLRENGLTVDRTTVTLPEADGAMPVRLNATPDSTGLVRYSALVSELDGELTTRNNSLSVPVQVLESERRILVVAAAPSPDLAALRGVLEEDRDYAVETRVQKSPGTFYEGPLPDPETFDLILLVGYPGYGASPSDLDRLRSAVSGGTPLLFVLGRGTDPALAARLGDALPVAPGEGSRRFVEARVEPTIQGRRHPVLVAPGVPDVDPWSVLPPLQVPERRWTAAPDAGILASPSIRDIGLDDPVLVVRRRAGSRSAALLATGFWRWSNLPADLDRVSGAWPGTVERLLQWLVAPEDDRPVRVRPVSPSFEGGAEIDFAGQVYDESLVPVPDASIDLEITTPDGRTLPYTLRPTGAGRYAGSLGVLPEGTYGYRAEAFRDEASLGTDRGSFSVGALSVEFMETGSDPGFMRQIALRSGGVFIEASDVAALPDSLGRRGLLSPTVRAVESATRLWQRWLFLGLVLVLLTSEWLLRKRRGLV